jgi:hypothetical protein
MAPNLKISDAGNFITIQNYSGTILLLLLIFYFAYFIN